MYPSGLVFGLLDTSDRINDPGLSAKLRNFTISWSRYDYHGIILEDASLNRLLDRALAHGYHWCLLQSHGHVFAEHWYPEHCGRTLTAAAITQLLQNCNFLVTGPIIGNDADGYGLDDQCLLVNLRTYAELGRPTFSAPVGDPVEMVMPSAGLDTANSPGMRQSLLPTASVCLRLPRQPGWSFIDASLRAGKPVRDFDCDLNRNRLYLGPISPHNQASLCHHLIHGSVGQGLTNNGDSLTRSQAQFLAAVGEQVGNGRRGIFLWNLESYADVRERPQGFRPPVATLYSVAAGFKPNFLLASLGFDEETRVVFFDYSPQALRVRKLLLQEWDGADYPRFLRYLFQVHPYPESFYQLWPGATADTVVGEDGEWLWEAETVKWGGPAVFKEHWQRYCRLRHEFVVCDILTEPEKLVAKVVPQAGSVVWWSNAFFTVYSNWSYTPDQRWWFYERWLADMAARDPGLFLYGADPDNSSVNQVQAGPYLEALQGRSRDPLVPNPCCGHVIRF